MNSIQNYSGNELHEQLRAQKTVDITVNGEEKRLIELFRGFNILGKAYTPQRRGTGYKQI